MRVLIVPNSENDRAIAAARTLVDWLESEGHLTVMVTEDAQAMGLPALGIGHADLGTPDLVVALGGDGTILRAVHLIGDAEAPILGVNLGRLGFLAGADSGELTEAVAAALAGNARVERRAMLEATLRVGGRDAGTYRALNEVYVGRGAGRAVDLAVRVNEHEAARFVCDGVVVATPTGSTAYSLSAGGPLMAPGVAGIAIVPVAAHTLSARPIVAGPTDEIEIVCLNPSRGDACVVVDGWPAPCRRSLDVAAIRQGSHTVSLVRPHGHDFYDVLRAKFLGGQH